MKKTLNLAIATGRTEELYKIHLKLAKEMETEIVSQVKNGNDIIEFASTINNPISIKTKGWKPKGFDYINANRKGKKREEFESDQNDKENIIDDESYEKLLCKKLQKILQDNRSNELTNGESSNKRTCKICNEKGYNA